MRKKIISVAIMLPTLLIIGIVCMAFTRSLSKTYMDVIREMEDHARQGDLSRAEQLLEQVIEEWDGKKPVLQLWVCHSETDSVTEHLLGVRIGLTLGDDALLFEHSAALIESLDHLYHRDDLAWSNIL